MSREPPEVLIKTVPNDRRSHLAYLELYRSEGTKDQISSVVKRYLSVVMGLANITDIEVASREYFASRGKNTEIYQQDVEPFFRSLQKDVPMTQAARLSYLRTYLQRNGAKFDEFVTLST